MAKTKREMSAVASTADAAAAGVEALYCISDLHCSARENMAWLEGLTARPHAALIVAGDVDEDLGVVDAALRLCARKFGVVFYCPGNHELWLCDDGAHRDSLAKLDAVLAVAERAGCRTTAATIGIGGGARTARVVPLLAWHHRSFDTEPPITCWAGLPGARDCLSDFHNCRWPRGLDDDSEDVARAVDALNDARSPPDPADRAGVDDVISFSHFLPRLELLPEKRFMYLPRRARARTRAATHHHNQTRE